MKKFILLFVALLAFISLPLLAQDDGGGIFDGGTIAYIVSIVLALLSTFFGIRYRKVKAALKETKEGIAAVIDAVEDDNVSKEEQDLIVKEWKEAAAAWGAVFKK